MSTQLAIFEPIKLPDPHRPATLPSLPAWVERLKGAVRLELQMTPDGKSFEDALVLSPEMMPSSDQRHAMTLHRDSLRSFLAETPASSAAAETRVATAVSKLLTVLAGERKSDLVEEARSEVYLDVLEDVPCWAVEGAVRAWFRHDCGTDERGRPHDYKWAPDPGTLRQIALIETYKLGARIGLIQRVLDAREYVDCSEELARGRAAMAGLRSAVRSGDLAAAASMTFDEAVRRGREPEGTPTREAAE